MKFKRPLLVVVTFLAASTCLWYFVGIERNYYAISSNLGSVESGSKFNIRIGQDYVSADKTLQASGFRFGYQEGSEFIYLDTGWRRGYVQITVENEIITKIRWQYDFMSI